MDTIIEIIGGGILPVIFGLIFILVVPRIVSNKLFPSCSSSMKKWCQIGYSLCGLLLIILGLLSLFQIITKTSINTKLMDKIEKDIIGGIILTIFGLIWIIFHKEIGRSTAEYNSKLFHTHLSEKWYQIGYLLWGLAFTIGGLLFLFGIIKSK